jgi:hypothetical protein
MIHPEILPNPSDRAHIAITEDEVEPDTYGMNADSVFISYSSVRCNVKLFLPYLYHVEIYYYYYDDGKKTSDLPVSSPDE